MPYDKEKFKNLVLYVIWRTGNVQNFGATKLNKVLWFSDARAYEAFGHSVTGETYIRRKFGPVPKHIDDILNELVLEGRTQAWTEPFFEYEVKRYAAHAPPDTSMFSAEQLGFVDWWIKHISENHTATSISEKSHDYGWQIAKDGKELPFKMVLAKRIREPVTGDELEWARKAAQEIGSP